MDFIKENDTSVNVVLTPSDVENAIRQFICACNPEYSKDWIIDAQYPLGTALIHMTKE